MAWGDRGIRRRLAPPYRALERSSTPIHRDEFWPPTPARAMAQARRARRRRLDARPSSRGHLRLMATRGVTIAVVSPRQRKWRQPGLATDDPAFVSWHQLVGRIQ